MPSRTTLNFDPTNNHAPSITSDSEWDRGLTLTNINVVPIANCQDPIALTEHTPSHPSADNYEKAHQWP